MLKWIITNNFNSLEIGFEDIFVFLSFFFIWQVQTAEEVSKNGKKNT